MYRFIFILSILIIWLSGCSSEDGYLQIIDEQGYNNIVHTEKLENGVIVFYVPDNKTNNADENYTALSASFIKKTNFGWSETFDRGGHSSSDRPELSSQYLYKSDDKSPFPMLFGIINNTEIKEIRIIDSRSSNPIQANIIENEEQRIWYSFLNHQKEDVEFEILGLTGDGEIMTSVINTDLKPSNFSSGTSN